MASGRLVVLPSASPKRQLSGNSTRRLAALLIWVALASACADPSPEPNLVYFCPMHPDYTSSAPDNCARCGMLMIAGDPLGTLPYAVEITTTPSPPPANAPIALQIRVTHPETGESIRDYTAIHDRPFHLFVVSQDLEHFFHVHPTLAADGSLRLGAGAGDAPEFAFPTPGYYKVYSIPTSFRREALLRS